MTTRESLIDIAESLFRCELGPPKAFFEIPQAKGGVVRVIYVTYVINGPDLGDLIEWMEWHVLRPLKDAGGEWLYWRLLEYFELEYNDDSTMTLRTRIGVIDGRLNRVVISDALKEEGMPVPRIGKDLVDVSAEG